MATKGAQLARIGDFGVIGTTVVGLYGLVTNDDETAIETDGYLDDDYERFPQGVSAVLMVLADRDGTPKMLQYLVTRTDGDIALTQFTDVA